MGRGEGATLELDELAEMISGTPQPSDADAEDLDASQIFAGGPLNSTPSIYRRPLSDIRRDGEELRVVALGELVCEQLRAAETPAEINQAADRLSEWLAALRGPCLVAPEGVGYYGAIGHAGVDSLDVLSSLALNIYHDKSPESAAEAARALQRTTRELELKRVLRGASMRSLIEENSPWLGEPSEAELAEICGVKEATLKRWHKKPSNTQGMFVFSEMRVAFFWIERELGMSPGEFRSWAERAETGLTPSVSWMERITSRGFWYYRGVSEQLVEAVRERRSDG